MTREEAISELQICVDAWDKALPGCPSLDKYKEAGRMAIASLRGPTREQVEAWPGCSYCQEGAYSDAAFDVMCRGEEADFCKFCGRPLTDEAVDIVMKRLEELYETE